MRRSVNARRLIEVELARLIDSDALRRAPSHMRLLHYLVERCIEGDDAALNEAAIAVAVFRRDPALYDPRVDPIVRVTMRRLRERLEGHYADCTKAPELRIELPPRSYVPRFVSRNGEHAWTRVRSGRED